MKTSEKITFLWLLAQYDEVDRRQTPATLIDSLIRTQTRTGTKLILIITMGNYEMKTLKMTEKYYAELRC